MPTDEQIQSVIERLEEERERLRRPVDPRAPVPAPDVARIEQLRVELDRLWDLLRQRRALRDSGQDPDLAHERAAEVVERYWQ